MKNDSNIAFAIGEAVKRRFNSNANLAREARVHAASIGYYRNGLEMEISEPVWEKIYPLIKQWLPNDTEYFPRSMLGNSNESKISVGFFPPELLPLIKAWPELCTVQRQEILDYAEYVVEKSKNKPHESAKKTA